MLAVHFGAGNIGRGFIGSLLYQSGYHTCFVDVNSQMVDLINERKEYTVVLADTSKEEFNVKNVSAINSLLEPEKVIESIAKADLITTAVGPNILPIISGLIAKGLQKRIEINKNPLVIIACENMVGGSTFLQEKVYEKVSIEEKEQFAKLYSFPDAAVDRIVPNQVNEDKLMVMVEPFFEWVVDNSKIIGDIPKVNGIKYVSGLKPFIERKLFTVNTGHSVAAFLGYFAGMKTINETMKNISISELVLKTLEETGELLVRKHGFDSQEHGDYIKKIMERFSNPFIVDEVTRVARSPLRKLGPEDRLISPAKQYLEVVGKEPIHLAKGIASALLYNNMEDEEAVELQETIKKDGVIAAIEKYTKLSNQTPLAQLIVQQYYLMEEK